jgi:hypothetical protein
MPLDPALLAKAQEAAAVMTDAEKKVLTARAEYNTSIRRLHLGGASLREIAQALGLSHQRVQQIVDAAGGSWWQRVWSTRTKSRDLMCTFCERPPSELSKLLAGPNIYICDECAAQAERALLHTRRSGRFAPVPPTSKQKCSFCAERRAPDRAIATSSAGNICAACVRICREILEMRS